MNQQAAQQSVSTENTSSTGLPITFLRVSGYGAFGVGAIGALILLAAGSKETIVSSGDVGPVEMGIAFGFLFYNVCLGAALLGIAEIVVVLSRGHSIASQAGTTCPKCLKKYSDDRTGQFCDDCGAKL